MAAIHSDLRAVDSNLNTTYSRTIEHAASQLPSGACNFRELARGTKSPVCGCKRFWLNSASVPESSNSDNAWCFCGHHACFHNAVSQQTQRLSTQSTVISSHNETSQSKPVRRTPEGYISVQQVAAPTGLGIRPDSRSHSQSINTRVWEALNGFAREQEGGVYSDQTTRLPSTAAGSVNGETQDMVRIMGPPVCIPLTTVTRPGAEDYQGSATEIATPSIAGTPDPQAFVPPGTQSKYSPRRTEALSQTGLTVLDSGHFSQSPRSNNISTHEIMNLLRAHSSRLDALDSLSFSHVPIEEVQDKFELFDSRMLDLEQWRGEVEDRLAAHEENRQSTATSKKRRLLPAEASSFASDESFDLSAAAHTEAAVLATIATNAELGPRIEMLECRVAGLEQASLPSFDNPWDVQVVLLPWGRNLRGVWYSMVDATQHSMRASVTDNDEWTGAQSQVKTSFRSSSSSDAWTTESIQAWAEGAQDWLSPKGCGPQGTVFQRLASRGMVQDVTFRASDSRHILDVLTATFKHILPQQKAVSDDSKQYQGLHAAFLPLRKVRKSTRLRFLSHAEMITSASWTAGFLESSVFMKASGQRRLYVTTPQAYLQAADSGMTWQQIRQLPARDGNGEEQAAQIDSSIAIEACWSYNDKLDHVPSLHSSFASHVSQAAWSTKSQQSIFEHNDAAGQLTPALSGHEQHKRTTSLPSSASAQDHARAALPKRRVTSFETGRTAALIINTSADSTKRRRLSNSPEAERRGVNFTPRWSREPPSPFHSENAGEARSQGVSSSRKRGTTPFAYATPHSNVHFTNPMDIIGDGDTERDSELYQSEGENDDEEEWNGMDTTDNAPVVSEIFPDEDDEFMDEEDMP